MDIVVVASLKVVDVVVVSGVDVCVVAVGLDVDAGAVVDDARVVSPVIGVSLVSIMLVELKRNLLKMLASLLLLLLLLL